MGQHAARGKRSNIVFRIGVAAAVVAMLVAGLVALQAGEAGFPMTHVGFGRSTSDTFKPVHAETGESLSPPLQYPSETLATDAASLFEEALRREGLDPGNQVTHVFFRTIKGYQVRSDYLLAEDGRAISPAFPFGECELPTLGPAQEGDIVTVSCLGGQTVHEVACANTTEASDFATFVKLGTPINDLPNLRPAKLIEKSGKLVYVHRLPEPVE